MIHISFARPSKLTKQQGQLLRATKVDQQHPGPILQDFETLLQFVDETAPQLTAGYQLPMRALALINGQLTRPLQHGLARPQQKSFPHINGLYWLLRASGLTHVDASGKKPRLLIDGDVRKSWEMLNSTERYCTLLETWVLRAQSEIIGERDAFGFNRVLEKWDALFRRLPDAGLVIVGNRDEEQHLGYYPEYHNLALMELFGLVEVQLAPTVDGKGWSIALLKRTKFGEALLVLVATAVYGKPGNEEKSGLLFQFHRASEVPIGALQPVFQPYFSNWQNNLVLPAAAPQEGVYIFNAALGKNLWRRIAIASEHTLDELSDAILDAYEFDHDHLYRFIYRNRFGGTDEVHHPYMDEPPFTSEVSIGELPLQVGETMVYNYDFGDNWEFAVTLERIDPPSTRQKRAEIIESKGAAPEQYPSWEDYEDEEYDDDEE